MGSTGRADMKVRSIGDFEKGPIEAWEEQRKRPWQPYVDAVLGFRNHWYPAFFSHELKEGDVSTGSGEPVKEFKSLTMLGERIIFRRLDGKVYAMQDWCLHRGVPFSARPECYTKERLTCWYHGFTYDIRDGVVKAIITDPHSPLIGKLKARTYAVEERKGIVFVFVGDLDPPPPLEDDVQPGLLDESFYVYPEGWSQEVKCNWRPAAENGFDPAHAYIHRNSEVVRNYKWPFVLGDTGLSRRRGMEIIDGPGPKGVKLLRGQGTPVWEAEVGEGVLVSSRFKPGDEGVSEGLVPEVSIWMPAGLWVEPAWREGGVHIEWYVPIDEYTHRYLITWGCWVQSPQHRDDFYNEVKTSWSITVPTQFNNEDVFARENMAEFYAKEDGWFRERLFAPDVVITEWRKLASKNNRGIQQRRLE